MMELNLEAQSISGQRMGNMKPKLNEDSLAQEQQLSATAAVPVQWIEFELKMSV